MDLVELKNKFNLSENQIGQFEKYYELLIEWNNKFNLTAITKKEDVILKHFYDSLTSLNYINNSSKIIDVGTGAGFPGIPLKIANNTFDVTLVDSLGKRVNFLNEVIRELKLDNINAIHGRAEDLGKNPEYREKYDVAISRAVANLSTLSEYLLPFVKVGGVAICMKGPNISEELEKGKKAIKILGGEIEKIDNFSLENGADIRNIIIVKKIKNTTKAYPRKAGMPSKEPII